MKAQSIIKYKYFTCIIHILIEKYIKVNIWIELIINNKNLIKRGITPGV